MHLSVTGKMVKGSKPNIHFWFLSFLLLAYHVLVDEAYTTENRALQYQKQVHFRTLHLENIKD